MSILWPKAQAKRAETTSSTLPPLPKVRLVNRLRLRLSCVAHPKQLQVTIGEEETTARCALPWMHVGCAFVKAKRRQSAGLLTTNRDADEGVVKFRCHFRAGVSVTPPNETWLTATNRFNSAKNLRGFTAAYLCKVLEIAGRCAAGRTSDRAGATQE
jgi:hypothetical protein